MGCLGALYMLSEEPEVGLGVLDLSPADWGSSPNRLWLKAVSLPSASSALLLLPPMDGAQEGVHVPQSLLCVIRVQ